MTKTLIAHIPWSRKAACVVAFFWACTAQAEGSPGVLPSRWVTGLPSVVLPGKHNAVDPVVLRGIVGGRRESLGERKCDPAVTQCG